MLESMRHYRTCPTVTSVTRDLFVWWGEWISPVSHYYFQFQSCTFSLHRCIASPISNSVCEQKHRKNFFFKFEDRACPIYWGEHASEAHSKFFYIWMPISLASYSPMALQCLYALSEQITSLCSMDANVRMLVRFETNSSVNDTFHLWRSQHYCEFVWEFSNRFDQLPSWKHDSNRNTQCKVILLLASEYQFFDWCFGRSLPLRLISTLIYGGLVFITLAQKNSALMQ